MIYRRAFVGECLSNAAVAFGIVATIAAMTTVARLFAQAGSGALPVSAVAGLLGFQMVKWMPQILCFSVFGGIVVSLGRMRADNEMWVWTSAGLRMRAWLVPVATIAAPMAVVTAWLTLSGAPWAIRNADVWSSSLANEAQLDRAAAGAFGEIQGGRYVYHFSRFDPELGEVRDVFLVRREGARHDVVLAAGGDVVKNAAGDPEIALGTGRYYGFSPGGGVDEIQFDNAQIALGSGGDSRSGRVRGLKTSALASDARSSARAEIAWRISFPISVLILAAIAVATGQARPRAAFAGNFAFALAVFWLYFSLLSLAKEWAAREDGWAAMALAVPHLLAIATAVAVARKTQ